ncbi:MAG: hypothetical protein Q4G36_08375 [Paracoccus sp. (in: a-proteobacteria)]|nr:hypothetical protein [Paracoccus sp. (in: a-proteobacteria)]
MDRPRGSYATMSQRAEPRDSLDDFPTPPWATRALCEAIRDYIDPHISQREAREPAANRGYMARPLAEYFARVEASDIKDYGAGYPVRDYLGAAPMPATHWTITNPPFRRAQDFITRALDTSSIGVAMLVRLAFIEGIHRHATLYGPRPPRFVLQFSERLPILRGRYDPKASTASAYCWLIWTPPQTRGAVTYLNWIAPCRRRLERADDIWPGAKSERESQ